MGQSPHTMYSNNILNCQESTTILNANTKKVWKLIEGTTYSLYIMYNQDLALNNPQGCHKTQPSNQEILCFYVLFFYVYTKVWIKSLQIVLFFINIVFFTIFVVKYLK